MIKKIQIILIVEEFIYPINIWNTQTSLTLSPYLLHTKNNYKHLIITVDNILGSSINISKLKTARTNYITSDLRQ